MGGSVSAIVLGNPFPAEGVFVVAHPWDHRLGVLHDNVLAIVGGREDLSFWNVVALHREVCRERSHILHEQRRCGVDHVDGLHARVGGVATLVGGGEGPHQGVRLGAVACQGVHRDRDVGWAAASVHGCGVVQRTCVAAVGDQVFWEEIPAWGRGVYDGDGLDLRCCVAAIVRGGECPNNAVRPGALAWHLHTVFHNGNVRRVRAVVHGGGLREHFLPTFHGHVGGEVDKLWCHLVHQGDELNERLHVATGVCGGVHPGELSNGLDAAAGGFVGFPGQVKVAIGLACGDVRSRVAVRVARHVDVVIPFQGRRGVVLQGDDLHLVVHVATDVGHGPCPLDLVGTLTFDPAEPHGFAVHEGGGQI